jgi:hypothetical protein
VLKFSCGPRDPGGSIDLRGCFLVGCAMPFGVVVPAILARRADSWSCKSSTAIGQAQTRRRSPVRCPAPACCPAASGSAVSVPQRSARMLAGNWPRQAPVVGGGVDRRAAQPAPWLRRCEPCPWGAAAACAGIRGVAGGSAVVPGQDFRGRDRGWVAPGRNRGSPHRIPRFYVFLANRWHLCVGVGLHSL